MWTMKTLSVLTRDTDIKGWYKDSGGPGSDLYRNEQPGNGDSARKKYTQACTRAGRMNSSYVIRISFHRFPDEGKPNKPGNPVDFTFYPDYPNMNDREKTPSR